MLLAATDLHYPILQTLTMHEDLIAKRVGPALHTIGEDGMAANKVIRSLAFTSTTPAAQAKSRLPALTPARLGSSAPTRSSSVPTPSFLTVTGRDSPLTEMSSDDGADSDSPTPKILRPK